MRALYQGYCRACRGTVNVGDSIVHQMENVNSHWDCDDPRGELTPTQRKQRAQEPTHEQLRSEQTAEQRALDDAEYAAEMRLVRHDNAEYARGVNDANQYRFERDTFGEEYAAKEEFARELRDPAY